MSINDFETSIEPVETGLTSTDHRDALEDYEAFMQLPYEVKSQIYFPGFPGNERNTAAGFVHKAAEGNRSGQFDRKQVFHYTPALLEHTDLKSLPGEAVALFGTARELHEIATGGFRRLMHRESQIIQDVHFPKGVRWNNHLRFLGYEGASPGDQIAEGHYDQAVVAMALFESSGGLRLGSSPADIRAYERDHDQTVAFLGRGWLKLHEELELPTRRLPVWHDVKIPEDEAGVSEVDAATVERVARKACVFFGNAVTVSAVPSKQETSTPLSQLDIQQLIEKGVLQSKRAAA